MTRAATGITTINVLMDSTEMFAITAKWGLFLIIMAANPVKRMINTAL